MPYPDAIAVSALERSGLDNLKERIDGGQNEPTRLLGFFVVIVGGGVRPGITQGGVRGRAFLFRPDDLFIGAWGIG